MNALIPPASYPASPEQRLILMLLGGCPPGQEGALADTVRQCNWKDLLGIAAPGIQPFLHHSLQQNGLLNSLPPEALAALERAKTDAVLRYMRRRKELETVFGLFRQQGIDVVALKGASLCESAYPLPYLRPMRDVDLWLAEAEMEHAQSILEGAGYRTKDPSKALEFDLESGKEIRLAKIFRHDISVIELHATLDIHLPEETDEVEAMWSRRIDHPVLRAKTLSPRDMLYHLCMHMALRHRFEQGLLWLLDVRLFLVQYGEQVDWDALAEDSHRQRTGKYLYTSLLMTAELLGGSIPEDALSKIEAPNDLSSVRSLVWQQIWESDFAILPPRRFLKLATAGSPGRMCAALADRLHKYSTQDSLDGRKPEGRLGRMRSAKEWIVSDLRKAYKAFRNGGFSRENLIRAFAMESRRTDFEREMQS